MQKQVQDQFQDKIIKKKYNKNENEKFLRLLIKIFVCFQTRQTQEIFGMVKISAHRPWY